jgi:hypothetical protein
MPVRGTTVQLCPWRHQWRKYTLNTLRFVFDIFFLESVWMGIILCFNMWSWSLQVLLIASHWNYVCVSTIWYQDWYIREKILSWQYSVTVRSTLCGICWSRWLPSKRRFNLFSCKFLEFASFVENCSSCVINIDYYILRHRILWLCKRSVVILL